MIPTRDERAALLSVWDKTGLTDFAQVLRDSGYGLIASSGTARALNEAGLPVRETGDLTGYPSILGGRVKTLHPAVFGGILARTDREEDEADRRRHRIPRIDLVVCTLYPFEETLASGADLAALIEKIDIGGVSLLRAAAKNHARVTVLCDPADYPRVAGEIRSGGVTEETRRELALKALARTAAYDAAIATGLPGAMGRDPFAEPTRRIALDRLCPLRYGENPHQRGGLFLRTGEEPRFRLLSGKEMSYNNFLDLDAAWRGVTLFGNPRDEGTACVIVKHGSPCGVALGSTPGAAFEAALASDPVSAYGGIVAWNGPVGPETAERLKERFFEVLAAPSFDPKALAFFRTTKPNLRILEIPGPVLPLSGERLLSTAFGILVQEESPAPAPDPEGGRWIGRPRPDLGRDLLVAWRAAAAAKSNAIAVARDGATVGIGGGFTNRVDAVRYALERAGDRARGAVLASDAFFPFPDSVDLAADAGVVALVQPGGSVRDEEVEAAALRRGLSMLVSGGRTFRH